MASSTPSASFIIAFFSLVFLLLFSDSYSSTFIITNKCQYTVWPGILSAAGTSPTTGFALQPGDSNTVPVGPAWSGSIWGRTLCSRDITTKFSCATGDCSSSTVECSGGNAAPPVTLAEFALNSTGGLDFFDVSLVDGFNLPVKVEPRGLTGAGSCRASGCVKDLNVACPEDLKVIRDGECVACKSACQGDACNSSSSLQFFKSACPRARVHAYDHGSFACASAHYIYTVTFCPTSSASLIKPGNKRYPPAVDNSGGHVDGSTTNGIKYTAVAVFIVTIFGLIICRIRIYLSNRDWAISVAAETRPESTIQMVNLVTG
ncbi:Thaumatin protein 1 [Spatholobus suberectus]|nr:Thaumatin protein 1 [Spatholobus suberectus]